MKTLIINEEQERALSFLLSEEAYQMPVDKKMNKPFCISPEKVQIAKRFLDSNFVKKKLETRGTDGLKKVVVFASVPSSNGKDDINRLYAEQLSDLLINKYQNMFLDKEERDAFFKFIVNAWFNDRIGALGQLSVNRIMSEGKLNEVSSEQIEAEALNVDLNPTDLQKEAGNYKMGHVSVKGFQITIENPRGSFRKYKNEDGTEGKNEMKNHYGYFTRTVGKDGDAVDVFLGPDTDNFERVYVVDQNNREGNFDESKVMFGFDSADEAKNAYLSNYSPDWKGFRAITGVSMRVFKKWLYRDRKQRKPFAEYVAIQKKKLEEAKLLPTDDYRNFRDYPIDRQGRPKPRIEYPSYDGWRIVRSKGKMNLQNEETGQILSPKWFDFCGYLIDGIAIVGDNGKYNLLGADGNLLLPNWYYDITDVNNDGTTFKINDNGTTFIVDRNQILK